MAAGGVMAGSVASEYPSAAEVARGAEEEEELATAESERGGRSAERALATLGAGACPPFSLVQKQHSHFRSFSRPNRTAQTQ